MVQKIAKTSLKPDLGCFVLFDGGFSGLVVINFSSAAAMEIYNNYMQHMGIPAEELASLHTSDEVGDVLGELMNQIIGDFTGKIKRSIQTSITQNQPKMMAVNKNLSVSVDSNIDKPQARRVSFTTENNHIFYLELAMERTEFIQLQDFEEGEEVNPDAILEEETVRQLEKKPTEKKGTGGGNNDLLDELGI
jgi:chemotaxis protein CheY-P-specific phosphatase CheC